MPHMFDLGLNMDLAPYLALAYTTYLVGTISPGPANLAIMSVSMESGRAAGLATASGVIAGSLIWGIIAGLGLGAILQTYATALSILKIVGGLYLLWLAFRAFRTALAPDGAIVPQTGGEARRRGPRALFLRGFAIHMTNPKALLVWMAIITLGLPADAPPELAALIVAGCAFLGVLVFGTFAVVFSSAAMVKLYLRLRRWINAVFGLFFGVAGLRLLSIQQ